MTAWWKRGSIGSAGGRDTEEHGCGHGEIPLAVRGTVHASSPNTVAPIASTQSEVLAVRSSGLRTPPVAAEICSATRPRRRRCALRLRLR